jgi:hypothetical protein
LSHAFKVEKLNDQTIFFLCSSWLLCRVLACWIMCWFTSAIFNKSLRFGLFGGVHYSRMYFFVKQKILWKKCATVFQQDWEPDSFGNLLVMRLAFSLWPKTPYSKLSYLSRRSMKCNPC